MRWGIPPPPDPPFNRHRKSERSWAQLPTRLKVLPEEIQAIVPIVVDVIKI